MRLPRSFLLVTSAILVLFVLGGGMAMKVGAGESSYHQVVLFSEILSLVLDNYVDPVAAEKLLGSAYEGMLGGLDANGAFLTADEVREWKRSKGDDLVDPGVSVLKSGQVLQIIAVDPDSPAAEGGIQVGDQVRSVDTKLVSDLSLSQAWRLIEGPAGSTVKLEVLHPADGFGREEIEVARSASRSPAYELNLDRGIAVLRIHDMRRIEAEEITRELDEIRSRGAERLLLDLRNVAEQEPRAAAKAAGLFSSGTLLCLRDRSGRLVESLESDREVPAWKGPIAVLVNGATAGGAEALVRVLQVERDGLVLGEATYGLGAEAKLYELEDGSGLLVSSALWETASGDSWNGKGIEPDHVVRGQGRDYGSAASDQLQRALDYLEQLDVAASGQRKAA